MTPEERERTMDFILRQQAQFEVDMQLSKERFEQFQEQYRREDLPRIKQVEAAVVTLTEIALLQSSRLDRSDAALAELKEMVRRMDERG